MNVLLVGLALAALPAQAELRQSLTAAPLTIYAAFERTPTEAMLATLREEAAAIMKPAGFRLDWRKLGPDSSREVSVELVVVTFTGSCEAGPPPLRSETTPLGRTHTSGGDVLPFVEIDCNHIRAFLSTSLAAFSAEERQEALGRAVARVLTHELYHVLARTTKHASWGIAKPCHTVQELLADTFRFEPKEEEQLRHCRAHVVLEQGEAPPVVAGQ